MAKMICQVCNSIVDEEDCYHFSQHWNDDMKATESFAGMRCPECGADGEFLTEAVTCERCHFVFEQGELIGGLLCEDCFRWAVKNHPEWVLDWMKFANVKGEFAEYVAERI